MWEIISYTQQRNILVQGRGSAANSAVCYVWELPQLIPLNILYLNSFCQMLTKDIQI